MATKDIHRNTPPPTTSADVSRARLFEREALALHDELGRAARRYSKNAHDAEDLVQETFAKAWAGFGSFDPGTNLRAWMFRIMVNTWISSHRRTERRPKETLTESFTDAQLVADSRRFDTSPSAEAQALQRLPDDRIRQAIQSLDPSLQRVVYYAFACQLSYKEIAEIEEIPLGTVMSRIHRGRRLLRTALATPLPPPATPLPPRACGSVQRHAGVSYKHARSHR
ncbi:MAG: sigma-70 family RNA polymerase sigma factor [Mycobacterium sp.]